MRPTVCIDPRPGRCPPWPLGRRSAVTVAVSVARGGTPILLLRKILLFLGWGEISRPGRERQKGEEDLGVQGSICCYSRPREEEG